MQRWFRKIIRVFLVVAIGAAGSLPFRRVPPPGGDLLPSADRLVLQNDSTRTVQELPLQIAPPSGGYDGAAPAAFAGSDDGPRTAAKSSPQSTRKSLPVWNSRLESSSPPPPLPDTFRDEPSTGP